nr:phospholipid hydroperoxide glutathione peroxidase [Phytophthora sojae]
MDVATDATVEFSEELKHGIKLANPKATEVFAAESKEKQEEWLNSFINAGAQYREVFNVADTAKIKSFYELKDFDMAGNEVSMAKYKGKVVLAVNVSSKCGLTPTNYPELQELYAKYKDEGLEVLAFPCNQFAGQEPGTHEEIMEFVKQYNVTFPFFEKHDVNGATARPVFTYLKTKLPGSFGDFVKWNFTKFLVDRNGQPYKRFAPKDRPLSFEEDIKTLLAQKASEE